MKNFPPPPSCVSLHYDGEVGGLLESRMILESDIRTVIEAAEGSGRKILHRASGCFIASRPRRQRDILGVLQAVERRLPPRQGV